jgi:hypothetical protein
VIEIGVGAALYSYKFISAMQLATISIGSPEGANKWVVQILFEKPADSDYNDQFANRKHKSLLLYTDFI